MRIDRSKCSCLSSRAKCFVIGYLHLLNAIRWPWLPPVLLIVNLGTHGFHPLPMTLSSVSVYMDYAVPLAGQPKCYPGMLHVHLIDVMNFFINVIWLNLVVSFIASLHKKDLEKTRMFFGASIVKLALQIIYISFHPSNLRGNTSEEFWILEILDICISAAFLMIINDYIRKMRVEKAQPVRDQPPSYIECLISSPANHQTKGKTISGEAQTPEETKKGDSPAILPI